MPRSPEEEGLIIGSYVLRSLFAVRRHPVEFGMRPISQRASDRRLRSLRPHAVARIAVRVQNLVLRVIDEFGDARLGARSDGLHILHDLLAEEVQGQVVDVVAEGVLDLVADEENAQDDVGRGDGGRDRDPAKLREQLEGQEEHVNPGDLRDGDGVCDGEGSVQDSFRVDHDVVQCLKAVV